ncbi:MAG: hypothetical protein DRP87_19515 [Spirochaetes bacterium]|nr:MAG: hypothetical protein DRP87_19515 [Spirochaetota bacterium]
MLLFSLYLIFPVCAEEFFTFRADFIRTVVYDEGSRERVKGSIYFEAPEKVLILIREPVLQWNVFKDRDVTIYYERSPLPMVVVHRSKDRWRDGLKPVYLLSEHTTT